MAEITSAKATAKTQKQFAFHLVRLVLLSILSAGNVLQMQLQS